MLFWKQGTLCAVALDTEEIVPSHCWLGKSWDQQSKLRGQLRFYYSKKGCLTL